MHLPAETRLHESAVPEQEAVGIEALTNVCKNAAMTAKAGVVLKSAWGEVTKGSNLDVLLLALTAGVFSVLSFYQEPRAGVAFAFAALYCGEIIRSRHKESKIEDALEELSLSIRDLVVRLEDPELGPLKSKFQSITSGSGQLPKEGRPLP